LSARLILASASPRRRELLQQIGLPFEVLPNADEELKPAGDPAKTFVVKSAEAKADGVFRLLAERGEERDIITIGADTIVCVDGRILGKPIDEQDAAGMLHLLSGRSHQVYTGLALVADSGRCSAYEVTQVRMAALSQATIDTYTASGEPLDKAGAYGIQGRAGRFIESVEGCYYNVVGLPLARLCTMLGEMGCDATAVIAANEMRQLR